LFLKSFSFCCLSEYIRDSFLFSVFVVSECECLIVLLYNRNVGLLPCFKHPYGLSSVNLIGEKVGVDTDNVVEGEGERDGERDGEHDGECEGDEDTNVSMMGIESMGMGMGMGMGMDMGMGMGMDMGMDMGSDSIVSMGADIGAVGINSGGSSVYIKFPASVIVVPCAKGFPKANVIFSFLGAES
jgi:hypothetical protein